MKKRNFLPLLQGACFLLVSLLLQSCGASFNLPLEGEQEPKETIKQIEGQVSQESNPLPAIMPEIWQYIFSYLDFDGVLAARSVSTDCNKLITGFMQAGIVGVENKPSHIIDTRSWTSKKEIYFNSDKLNTLTPATIPSFTLYHLMGHVRNLPQSWWSYLQGTNVQRVDLSWNQIGDTGASQLAQHLQGTHVHTVHLSGNQIGAQGAEGFAKHLQETLVHTIDLSHNQIGAAGAIELAKVLPGTQVHTLDLGGNYLGDQGAEALARHLQGTQVHTVNLGENQIGNQGAEGLARLLQETRVHTVHLSGNDIGNQGAEEFAKHLQGTQVHTVFLRWNGIGDQGAIKFAKHLQGTRVHTVELGNNNIGPDVQRLLVGQYPRIKWVF